VVCSNWRTTLNVTLELGGATRRGRLRTVTMILATSTGPHPPKSVIDRLGDAAARSEPLWRYSILRPHDVCANGVSRRESCALASNRPGVLPGARDSQSLHVKVQGGASHTQASGSAVRTSDNSLRVFQRFAAMIALGLFQRDGFRRAIFTLPQSFETRT